MVSIADIVNLQECYATLLRERQLSKKAICDLCVPFRDKAGLTDLQTLQIARQELSFTEVVCLCGIDKLHKMASNSDFREAMSELNFYRNCHYADVSTSEEYKLANAINTVLPVLAQLVGCDNER